jgi:hypothetical protein
VRAPAADERGQHVFELFVKLVVMVDRGVWWDFSNLVQVHRRVNLSYDPYGGIV